MIREGRAPLGLSKLSRVPTPSSTLKDRPAKLQSYGRDTDKGEVEVVRLPAKVGGNWCHQGRGER
jgi:hypothetical protein